jgi:hypothetical protein
MGVRISKEMNEELGKLKLVKDSHLLGTPSALPKLFVNDTYGVIIMRGA